MPYRSTRTTHSTIRPKVCQQMCKKLMQYAKSQIFSSENCSLTNRVQLHNGPQLCYPTIHSGHCSKSYMSVFKQEARIVMRATG